MTATEHDDISGTHASGSTEAAISPSLQEADTASSPNVDGSHATKHALRRRKGTAKEASCKDSKVEDLQGNRDKRPTFSSQAHAQMEELYRRVISQEATIRHLYVWGLLLMVTLCVMVAAIYAMKVNEHSAMELLSVMRDNLEMERQLDRLKDWWQQSTAQVSVDFEPGHEAARKGWTPAYNVLLVPGFITSGLELWQGPPCAAKLFRTRVWGQLGMLSTMLRNMSCFLDIMHLSPESGMDPPGIRLRAMQSLAAIDEWMPGYSVWAGIIRSLADLGYDPEHDLACAPFDWRLSMDRMEIRDKWFTKVKDHVEMKFAITGRKTLILGHSWGANVVLNFLYHMEDEQPGWVDRHVATFVDIAGPLLGVPKAISSLLSGEARDTVELGPLTRYLTENYVGKKARAALFRTWGSAVQMLPVGGPAVWGNATWAPDDTQPMRRKGKTYGPMLSVWINSNNNDHGEDGSRSGTTGETKDRSATPNTEVQSAAANDTVSKTQCGTESVSAPVSKPGVQGSALPDWLRPPQWLAGAANHSSHMLLEQLDADEAVSAVMEDAGSTFANNWLQWLDTATEGRTVSKVFEAQKTARVKMHDPMQTPLPRAPSLKIYCLYGVGLPADRAYHYLVQTDVQAAAADGVDTSRQSNPLTPGGVHDSCVPKHTSEGKRGSSGSRMSWEIKADMQDAEQSMESGVVTADGDGTVPALSMGVMCRRPWAWGSPLNPSNIKVVTREYQHVERSGISFQLQGGPESAAHVDILVNHALLADVVALAAGKEELVQDRVVSRIDEMAEAVWREKSRRQRI